MATVTYPPNPRPANWKTLAPTPKSGQTFAAQDGLPSLPVLPLAPTLAKFKESIRTLAHSPEEYAAAVAKVDKFAASQQAKALQERLEARGQETGRRHWLEEWWDDAGYQGYRDSVVVNVSYFYGFDKHPSHLPQTPVSRAAGIARAALTYRKQLYAGQVAPDATKEGSICMDSLRWMFDCSRVPGTEGLDWSVTYANATPPPRGHIIALRKNRFWKIDAPADGGILSTAEFEKQFQHIYDNSTKEYPGVGILTASNRDVWAQDYVELSSAPQNAAILKEIDSSAFVICLDDAKPTSSVAFSRALWHGDVVDGVPVGLRNRWVDKPIQFIVFDNAEAGMMGEHSVMDGTPPATFCDNILDMLADKSWDHGSPSPSLVSPATPLDFEISSKTLSAIESAEAAASTLVTDQVLGFTRSTYGKKQIKAFGVSPDSWTQMTIQLAYARWLKKEGKMRAGATYEAATTRKFFKGRTEAIRVVSSESDAWVASMNDASVSIEERKALFAKATGKHITLAKEAGNGKGVDRHLFGLKKSLKEGEAMPEMFSDPLVARSSNWVLSTSAINCKHFQAYGWGEVVPEGFGVAYTTGFDDYLQFTVTSRKELSNSKFCEEIDKAAVDLYNLYANNGSGPKSKL